MSADYRHLSYEQRCQIETLKKRGDSVKFIARMLNVDKSTVYRELKRNSHERLYFSFSAQEKSKERRSLASNQAHKMTAELLLKINDKLALQWSPEQISGWLKTKDRTVSISHESIYRHIWKDKKRGGNLYKNLRHKGKKYIKRGAFKAGRGCIPDRIDIDERPSIVDEKSRIGDWEIDTIIGKDHKGAIVSMVERGSKYTLLLKVTSKKANKVTKALIIRLGEFKDKVLTVTADNGLEFSRHKEVALALEADFYFAKPYRSWERGLNEHTNGLVRQYFPKKTDFINLSHGEVDKVEKLLNKRPRKSLNFKTPIEVFNQKNLGYNGVSICCTS